MAVLGARGNDPERLGAAADAYRAALEEFTRQRASLRWAATQNNLGDALHAQAETVEGGERARLLAEAVAAIRACAEVYTAESHPKWFQARQGWIEKIEAEIERLEAP